MLHQMEVFLMCIRFFSAAETCNELVLCKSRTDCVPYAEDEIKVGHITASSPIQITVRGITLVTLHPLLGV